MCGGRYMDLEFLGPVVAVVLEVVRVLAEPYPSGSSSTLFGSVAPASGFLL